MTDSVVDRITYDEAREIYPGLCTALMVLKRLHKKLVELPESEYLGKVESFQMQIQEKIARIEERFNNKE